jgi:MFS family permease
MEVKMSEDIFLTIVAFPLMFAFMGWLLWSILEWFRMRSKSQLQNKILEKFTTVQEFNEFIQSEEGNKFLKFISYNGFAPRQRILSSLSRGIIISFIGVSLILIGQIFTGEMKYFLAFGIIFIALGLGFLASTLISYTLSKKWGIINGDK